MTAATSVAGSATVMVAGDVFPNLPDGEASFRNLRGLLSSANLVVGNCEGVYTDRPAPSPSHKHMMVAPPANGEFLGSVPFHAMTLANNHMMDAGYVGLADTAGLLQRTGIATFGAGDTMDQALRPHIVELAGRRVAFLAYCSVMPVGYEARPNRPGVAALRVRTFYADPDPNFWEPGIAPTIITSPLREDLERIRQAIVDARQLADIVIVMPHWGYSSRLEILQDYELELAHDAVDHGASAVLCAHHHSLRGVELYRDRPIYFGLGTLVHHLRTLYPPTERELERRREKFGAEAHIPDPQYPLFPFHPDARMTGIAVIDVGPNGDINPGLCLGEILPDGSTDALCVGDPRARRVAAYLERITRRVGFDTNYKMSDRDGWAYLSIQGGGQLQPQETRTSRVDVQR